MDEKSKPHSDHRSCPRFCCELRGGLDPGLSGWLRRLSACNVGDPGSTLAREDPLEKETATHSSVLTWRIPWTEEPGGLQSTGSQRAGRD